MKIVHFFSESHLKFPSTTPPLFSASPFQLNPTWKLGSRLFKKHPCNFLLVLVYIFAHLRVTSYAVCLHWQVVLFNYSFLHNCTASCYWVHHRAGKGRLKIADGAHSDGDPPTASSLFTSWAGFPQIWRLNKDGVLQPLLAGAAAQSIGNWMVIQCRRFGNFRWCRTKGWPRGWSPRTRSRLITYRGAVLEFALQAAGWRPPVGIGLPYSTYSLALKWLVCDIDQMCVRLWRGQMSKFQQILSFWDRRPRQ